MQATMQRGERPDARERKRMAYTAGQAAKAAGVSTATISRALKRGLISGSKQPDGSWQLNPAEVHRVFPALAVQEPETPFMQSTAIAAQEPERAGEIAALQAQLDAAKETLADIREDRDRWRGMAERLSLAPPQARPSRSLWQRLFG